MHGASAVALALLVVQPNLVMGQATADLPTRQDAGLVLAVRVPVSVNIPSARTDPPTPPIPTWRSFAELEELRLELQFTNESQVPLWLYRGELRNAVQFRVDGGGTLPVAVRWFDEMNVYEERLPVFVPPDETVLLEPQSFVISTVGLRRVDGQPFGAGEYLLMLDRHNVRRAVRDSNGETWGGRVPPDGTFRVVVRVELPTNRAEAGHRYILEAEENASRDEYTAALNAYSRAAVVNPDDLSGIVGMAHMYRQLNRYREAVPLYERSVAGSVRPNVLLSFFLALAYVGAGEEDKAVNALRASGVPESEIPNQIQALRERATFDRLQLER